jgi:hypothetical protein
VKFNVSQVSMNKLLRMREEKNEKEKMGGESFIHRKCYYLSTIDLPMAEFSLWTA